MNIYTVAQKQNICHGHGDYRDELHIIQDEIGNFPFCFKTQAEAATWAAMNVNHCFSPVIVTLHLQD